MPNARITTIATYGVLATAAAVAIMLPTDIAVPTVSAAPPPKLELTGVIRDFHSSHPDFGLSSSTGFVAGSVKDQIGTFGVPELSGAGLLVASPWRDASNRPIAPMWYNRYDPPLSCFTAPGIAVDGAVLNTNNSVVDSFDSTLGPYGGANVGKDALISTNGTSTEIVKVINSSFMYGDVYVGPGGDPSDAFILGSSSYLSGTVSTLSTTIPMPVLYPPRTLSRTASQGDLSIASDTTISGDLHVDKLTIDGAKVQIDGVVTILCDDEFTLVKQGGSLASVELLPGAQLRIYLMDDAAIRGALNVNTMDPTRCTIYKLGAGTVQIDSKNGQVVARILAPEGQLAVRNSAEVYGTYVGSLIDLDNSAMFHVDTASSGEPNFASDVAGAFGGSSGGEVSSATSFRSWFRDEPGANISGTYTLVLDPAGGAYQFKAAAFNPIDGIYYGNEGLGQNYGFTFTFTAEFLNTSCAGYFIEYAGDDDLWIFIDDVLVMDVGGVVPGTGQYLDVNRLSLDDGRTYTLKFYYAQRQTSSSAFSLRTNIPLVTPTVTRTVSAPYD